MRTIRDHLAVASTVAALFVFAACQAAPVRPLGAGRLVGTLTLTDWRATNSVGRAGASLFGIVESRGGTDTLFAVRSDAASETTLHVTEQAGGMQAAGSFIVSPSAPVTLRDRGPHVMMVALSRVLEPGDSISVTLQFRSAGDVTLRVPVFRMTEASTERP